MISVFDLFKVGIGPSSSHTVGPMKAARAFVQELAQQGLLDGVERIEVGIYGSLSLTGLGHSTDTALLLGLAGFSPDDVEIEAIPHFLERVERDQLLALTSSKSIAFDRARDLVFHRTFLPLHENGMRFRAFAGGELCYSQTYYSIGGGFIVDEAHFNQVETAPQPLPLPYASAADVLAACDSHGIAISTFMLKNESALRPMAEVKAYLHHIWATMWACIQRGMHTEGILPGKLKLPRRATALRRLLESNNTLSNDPMKIIDWVNMFALAVNEENAAGGRVVTAPTNGACGIVPAVLAYYQQFISPLNDDIIERYLLSCGVIGSLYKMNASISGAEVGCQGEVGVACSMAAAGLTEILGGSSEQVCIAAEIAMEHNLGLTCDPVNGQVQVPCIERNAIAAVKAINASRMALRRTTRPSVTLDKVIETMFETGKDMNAKYRETATGGLAIKIVPCD
ncbi:L-serine ammonia-lyase [Pasteurellaceae bacterium TAE3-ERU1]|nr:L-serine ammonia-lyase [Pasteurellaceae bacterium TAE3-ERU1]